MEVLLPILIIVALGFLVYGWIRLRQEISAKITPADFPESAPRGRGGGGQNTPHHPEISVCSRTP